jgi:hypothetical protein
METSIYLLAGDSYELELLNKKPAEELRARCGLSWLYETLTSIKNKSWCFVCRFSSILIVVQQLICLMLKLVGVQINSLP